MRKILLFNGVLLLFAFLFVQTSFAQVILSEGAKASLGKGPIEDIAYSPDGARLAVANSIGLWLYDMHTAEVVQLKGHTGVVNSVAFAPDGATLASGSRDKTIRFRDVGSD